MKKQISFLVIPLLFLSLLVNSSFVYAQQSVSPDFNPSNLIDDSLFSNTSTFSSASKIQSFLEDKGSVLANTSASFVAQLKEPTGTMLKQTLEDPNPSNENPRTAAQLIYDASKSSGLNAQVILVTLNKEQSLITGHQSDSADQLQRALDFSMGFGCPDSQPCGDIYRGFYAQLFGGVDTENNRYLGAAKSLYKSFSTPGGRGPYINGSTSKVGDTITLPNTLGGYDGVQPNQTITLSNAATAALYRYTPHIFNGNYNFWRFYTAWFGKSSSSSSGGTKTPTSSGSSDSQTASGMVRSSSGNGLFFIDLNNRYTLMAFAAKANGLTISRAKSVSDATLNKYPLAGLYRIPDNTLISVNDKYYVFSNNQKQLITPDGIAARGLKITKAIDTPLQDAARYPDSGTVVPAPLTNPTPMPSPAPTPSPTPSPTNSDLQEGAVLKTASNPAVYLVAGGKLKLFTYATFLQYNAAAQIKLMADGSLDKYAKDGLVLPKDKSLIKSATSPTIFFYEDGKKKPMDAEIFRNRGFSFSNIFVLTDAEINPLPLGNFPDPVDGTYFKAKDNGALYQFKGGKKISISSFVAGQRKITPDFTFGADHINSMTAGAPMPPKDGSIVKGDKKTDVFVVSGGVLFPITADAFKARGYTYAQIGGISQAEVDSYAKGSLLTK